MSNDDEYEDKEKAREKIEKATRKFLMKGGKIEQLDPGESSEGIIEMTERLRANANKLFRKGKF